MDSKRTSTIRRTSIGKSPSPATQYVSKVTTMKRLERAKMDSMINRLRTEPEESEGNKSNGFYDPDREIRTMTGLPWKIRNQLETGRLVEKSSSEILAARPQITHFVFAYGNTNDEEIDSEEDNPSKSSMKTNNAPFKSLKATANAAKAADEQEDIYYRDWATSDSQFLEHSKNLINKTQNILEKAGLVRNPNETEMSPYMDKCQNQSDVEDQELKEGIQAFTAKKSKALIHPKVHNFKTPDSSRSRLTIRASRSRSLKSKKNVRIFEPEPPISTFVPTGNLYPIEKEEKIDRHLQQQKEKMLAKHGEMNDPQKFQEYSKKKREMMEVALQAYDPDSPTYDVKPDLNETPFEDDEEHTEALTLLYGALANRNQSKLNKFLEDGTKTKLRGSSKLPTQASANALALRPLDHFKGSAISSVLREIKLAEEKKASREFPNTYTTNESNRFSQKENKARLDARRIIDTFRLSKNHERKRFPGVTIVPPNTFFQDDTNDEFEPRYLIVNNVPTTPIPGPRSRPGQGIMKRSKQAQHPIPASNRVRAHKESTKSKDNHIADVGRSIDFGSPLVTKLVESLNNLKLTHGSEINMNLKASLLNKLSKNKKYEDPSIRGAQHKVKHGKVVTDELNALPELSTKIGKVRKNVGLGHGKNN